MLPIYLKEIRSFFNSLVAYIVIGVFLTGIGMYTWWFGDNIFLISEAQLNVLFDGAPYFFIFLIPAITMRSFSEELKTGTMEMLLTKPLGHWRIILGKYFACLTLVILCLLPTIVYYFSVYSLGDPVGNIDSAVVFGSYFGLILYAMVLTGFGILASSLTNNQIVAFSLGVIFCAFLVEGTYHIGVLTDSQTAYELSMYYNYSSLSVGVVDTRNVVYFLGLTALSLLITQLLFQLGNKKMARLKKDYTIGGIVFAVIIAAHIVSGSFYARVDLTEDGRYSLRESTINMIKRAEGTFEMEIFLDGDLPGNYQQMKATLKEKLEDIRVRVGKGKLSYYFTDPKTLSDTSRNDLMQYGVYPFQVNTFGDGEANAKVIYPGAAMRYYNLEGERKSYPTMFLPQEARAMTEDERFIRGMNELEYAIAAPVIQLTTERPKTVAFLSGHGEPNHKIHAENYQYLARFYNVIEMNLTHAASINRDSVDILIVDKPMVAFSEADKYKIDHYINQGGNVMFLIDMVQLQINDSLAAFIGIDNRLNLKDMFFTYGVRMNSDIILDDECVKLRLVRGQQGMESITEAPVRFDPILKTFSDHPIVQNIEGLYTRKVGTIDTVNSSGVKKTPLIYTTVNARSNGGVPFVYTFAELANKIEGTQQRMGNLPVSYLLEGEFPQHYRDGRGRPAPAGVKKLKYSETPKKGKVLIMSDGDVILPMEYENYNRTGRLMNVGYEKNSKRRYDNIRFLKRAVDYMNDRDMIEDLRVKNIVYRPLNDIKVKEEKQFWRWLNLVLPPLLPVLLFYFIPLAYRKVRKRE